MKCAGDEVVDPGIQELGPGQIRDANRAMLVAAAAQAGYKVRVCMCVRVRTRLHTPLAKPAQVDCSFVLLSFLTLSLRSMHLLHTDLFVLSLGV